MRAHHRAAREQVSARALSDAWALHDAQMQWTARVDAKAAYALAFQGALLTITVALATSFTETWEKAVVAAGVVLIVCGALFATSAVAPRLRAGLAPAVAQDNFVYFGHAQYWSPAAISAALHDSDITDQLTRQVVVMAQIAWRKHLLVGVSLWLGLSGGVIVLITGVVSRL